MADIFNVQPPAWLQELTHSDSRGLGRALGTLVGGAVIATDKATDENEQRSWFKLLPESLGEARLSLMDPMYKLTIQQNQMEIASKALGLDEMQQRIDLNKTKLRLNAEDLATVPKWLQDHPTVESRMTAEWPTALTPEWNSNLNDLRLRDSQSTLAKTTVTGLKDLSDAVQEISKFDGVKAGELSAKIQPFAVKGQMPPPELTAQVMAARGEAERKKLELQADAPTADMKNVQAVTKMRSEAEALRAKGDAAGYQAKNAEADLLEQRLKKSGQEITVETPGGQTVKVSTGVTKPTTSTATNIQQKNIAYSNALRGISDVLVKVRPQDVGIAGVVGENVFDTWIEQFKPGSANKERIQNRTALRMLREDLFGALSPERLSGSAFSNRDVDRLKELASNLEASTSYKQFQERVGEIQGIIKERVRTNASALGEAVPDSVKTLPELKGEYESQVTAINKMLTENRLTREQAQERINALVERIRDVTRSNFGIDNPFE